LILLTEANDSDRFGMEPLRWQLVPAIPIPTAVIVCANNHVGTLHDHKINTDGHVSPSVVCPEDDCDWHHIIQLVGWEG